MAVHNYILVSIQCPRCSSHEDATIDTMFGDIQMGRLHVGDKYPWRERKAVQNGGRPPNGNMDGEGYTECTHCKKDFWVSIKIRSDIITGVEVDLTKQTYIHD